MASKDKVSPVVEVAKAVEGTVDTTITVLSTGIRARIVPVAASLIDEVTSRIPDPDVPTFFNKDKEREEQNPLDPNYLKALEKANHTRGVVAIDAMVMFGVNLVDPMPADDTWIKKLKFLGIEFDSSDPFEREFHYKKYVATGSADLGVIAAMSGIRQEDIERAERSFRPN